MKGGYGDDSIAATERLQRLRKRLGGGYWRLGMRLGLVLGYGNASRVESRLEPSWGGGLPLPSSDSPSGGGGRWPRHKGQRARGGGGGVTPQHPPGRGSGCLGLVTRGGLPSKGPPQKGEGNQGGHTTPAVSGLPRWGRGGLKVWRAESVPSGRSAPPSHHRPTPATQQRDSNTLVNKMTVAGLQRPEGLLQPLQELDGRLERGLLPLHDLHECHVALSKGGGRERG